MILIFCKSCCEGSRHDFIDTCGIAMEFGDGSKSISTFRSLMPRYVYVECNAFDSACSL